MAHNFAFSANGTKRPAGRPRSWFCEWYEATRTPKRTAFNWWQAFVREVAPTVDGEALTSPSKAPFQVQQAFFSWLGAVAQKDAAERKRRAEEAAEEAELRERHARIERTKAAIDRHARQLWLDGVTTEDAEAYFASVLRTWEE